MNASLAFRPLHLLAALIIAGAILAGCIPVPPPAAGPEATAWVQAPTPIATLEIAATAVPSAVPVTATAVPTVESPTRPPTREAAAIVTLTPAPEFAPASGQENFPALTPPPTLEVVEAPAGAATGEAARLWPSPDWPTSTPEEQGIDSQPLEAMMAEIEQRKINIDGLLVIRNGRLVYEKYWGGYDKEMAHNLQSVGRSFTAALVGIAIDKGFIESVDQKVLDFFPDRTFANTDDRKRSMTLEDVLTMRTGLDYLESSGDQEEVKASKDWLQAILDRPMIGEPGTGWNYCAACSHILMKIVEQASGMNPREFADKYLFEPTGMKVGRWMADPQGVPYGAGGMTITPREAANLGYLFLNEGQWDGNQVISPEWIAASTSKHADIDVNAHFEYGYHWFTMPEFKGYAALGTGGQIILVIPEKALVIMTTADTEESLFELIGKYILPAVQ